MTTVATIHKVELTYTSSDDTLRAKMSFDYNRSTNIFVYNNTFSTDRSFVLYSDNSRCPIQDLTVLKEEEFFQLSLVWTNNLPIELVRSMQSFILDSEGLWKKSNKFECTIQY